ncbi:putative nucleic-acid-binding protein [Roseiarcus fermentans]|uniref:Ribonuclease VapC n=1 Tax=Roseiarcus fermentans TaxID=1473586 RepID=A0A366FIE2_9HYPH|nr:type II toxin-antitoxin system VapC family toxin [Roseiarcus fermentans]RBP14351.1 putative nucleic-acid-binding protein [Roseiarcus fermentans]
MIAIDTNVVVRYLTSDDPGQFRRAKALVEGGPVFLCTTVLLEVEWVLRSLYRLERPVVLRALASFVRLPTVRLEAAAVARQALDWAEQGMDFADALHLASSTAAETFATFDRALARAAARIGAPPVRAP